MFTAKESAVLTTSITRMPQDEALEWIEANHGIKLTRNQYYYTLMRIDQKAAKRKRKFILEGVYKQHILAIDRLEEVLRLTFENGRDAKKDGQFRTAQFCFNSVIRIQESITMHYNQMQDVIEYDQDKQASLASSRGSPGSEAGDFFAATEQGSRPGSRPPASY